MANAKLFSRPVFDQSLRVHSDHAQRLLERGFHRVVRALYGIEVVLRILGEEGEMDAIEQIVSERIDACAAELRAERARLEKLCADHGVTERARYTHPEEVRVRISSPQVAQYAALIRELDELMMAMDTLWLTGVLSNKQRADAAFTWRRRVLALGREIIAIEERARASARRKTGSSAAVEIELDPGADAVEAGDASAPAELTQQAEAESMTAPAVEGAERP